MWFSFLNVHEGVEVTYGPVAPYLSSVFYHGGVHIPVLALEQVCESGGGDLMLVDGLFLNKMILTRLGP